MWVLLLIILATAYLTFSFRMDYNHKGPGLFSGFVRGVDGTSTRPVGLFDWIRRPFGVYNISKTNDMVIWQVRVQPEFSAWYCPFCLSFWTQIPLFIYEGFVLQQLDVTLYPMYLLVVPLLAGSINTLQTLLVEFEPVHE